MSNPGSNPTAPITAAAVAGPMLVSISGQPGSDPLAHDGNIVLTFDQPLTIASPYAWFYVLTGYTRLFVMRMDSPRVVVSGNTITLDPELPLPVDRTIRINLDANAVHGLDGSRSPAIQTDIQTADTVAPLALSGTGDRDYLSAGSGDDTIHGGDASDQIFGNGGDDLLYGDGTLYLEGDWIYGGEGNDTLYGGHGEDKLDGGAGDDLLDGGSHDDIITDSAGANTLAGGEGNDSITSNGTAMPGIDAGSGNDTIVVTLDPSVPGAATAAGADGDDSLRFSSPSAPLATLTLGGGAGVDTYTPGPYSGGIWSATITDFAAGAGGDRIDLIEHVLPADFAGNPFAGSTPLLRLVQSGSDTLLELRNGTQYEQILRLRNVTASLLSGQNFVGGISPDGALTGAVLTGTEFRDVLAGYLLNDTIDGLAGLDIIYGRGGDDYLTGGADVPEDRPDDLYGEAGNDTLLGGGGEDQLQGGPGNDKLQGQLGNDSLFGNAGDDSLDGGAGDDALTGGDGNDTLAGGDGDDSIRVTAVSGAGGRHSVDGGAGNDTIMVEFVNGQSASVVARGGAGSDLFIVTSNHLDVAFSITDFELGGIDHLDLLDLLPSSLGDANPFGAAGYLRATQDGTATLISRDRDGAAGTFYGWEAVVRLEGVSLAALQPQSFVGNLNPGGAEGGDVFAGTSGADLYEGGAGADSLTGLEGNDTLVGHDGDDVIHGGGGANVQSSDNDLVRGGGGQDRLYGESGSDTLQGGDGNDTLQGGDGADLLDGGAGANLIQGDAGDDIFDAGAGADTLSGGAGADHFQFRSRLTGTSVVQGGSGDDRISLFYTSEFALPETNHDVRATGGEGTDTYVFERHASGWDVRYEGELTITDFQPGAGGDVLDLYGLLQNGFDFAGGNPFGERNLLQAVQQGADTLIYAGLSQPPIVVLLGVDKNALTGENFVGYFNPSGTASGKDFHGGALADIEPGTVMHDTLSGAAGDDTLGGQAGDDMLSGGADNDHLDGGEGSDSLYGGAGNDFLFDDGTTGTNTMDGGIGDDTLVSGRYGPSLMDGGDGDDILLTMVGSDTLLGGAGSDAFASLGRTNSVYEDVRVEVAGGDGNDHFICWDWAGRGAEVLFTGGAGTDTYHVAWGAKSGDHPLMATVTDFQPGAGGDVLDLRGLGIADPFGSGLVKALQIGADTILFVRPIGSDFGVGSYLLQNVTASSLVPSNFILPAMETGGVRLAYSSALHGETLQGDARDDALFGGMFDDTLSGGAGRDRIDGGKGQDRLNGGAGSDLLSGGEGSDSIEGGDGVDWVLLPHAAWTVARTSGGWLVTDTTSPNDKDILTGVERVLLPSEQAIALDVDGDAGTVFRLYQASFHRTPDPAGMGYWLAAADRDFSFDWMAAQFMQSPEFASLYGSAPTNRDLVRLFYVNALHREPDQAGLDFWTGVLDRGGASVGQVLMGFSDSAENQSATATLVGNGIPFIPYGGV